MGRKIPARKHHGVRDPIRQNAKKLALIKDKINHPPEKKDYQKISHKLADFIKLKDQAKSGAKLKMRKLDEDEDKPENYQKTKPNFRHNKQLSDIRRYPSESEKHYLQRVNRLTRESIQESQFERKYGVEVIRNQRTGEITLKKRPKDELEEEMKKNADSTKKKKKVEQNVLTAKERNKLAKEAIKKKKKEQSDIQISEYKRDEIKFGEVVHAPPHLPTPRLAKKAETVPRPGKKPLLLHSIFQQQVTGEPLDKKSTTSKIVQKSSGVDLKGKRKDLPMATRHMIEEQQKNVVSLYKELKKNRRQQEII